MELSYASQRMPVLASNAVATSQPLAAQAGLEMRRSRGNAADAALATAIALTVVEPAMNGIGSDAFCILWDGKELHGLNASGRALRRGLQPILPGANRCRKAAGIPSPCPAVYQRGQRFLTALEHCPCSTFRTGHSLRRIGLLVGPITAEAWAGAAKVLGSYEGFAQTFLPMGRAPRVGERFLCAAQARTVSA